MTFTTGAVLALSMLSSVVATTSAVAAHDSAGSSFSRGVPDIISAVPLLPRILGIGLTSKVHEHLLQPDAATVVPDSNSWQARFAAGLELSKKLIDAGDEQFTGAWAIDRHQSAAAPAIMLRAEEFLFAADEAATAKERKDKTAERALRLYYHAKWLAERNFVRGAEWRYREACTIAKQVGRKVLAGHALSRLGYFLIQWNRETEAAEVLRESERTSTKSNPLAPFLYGVLERKIAGADVERLNAAEDRILNSAEQPSEDLELQRQNVVQEIQFWRDAKRSLRNCFTTFDAAKVLICTSSHLVSSMSKVFAH